jgi:hypothetical protein
MRWIVFVAIAGVAGFMAWLWLQPACRDGVVVKDEAGCRAVAGFDAAFCRAAFARATEIAARAAYPTRDACLNDFPVCDVTPGASRAPPAKAVSSPSTTGGDDRALAQPEFSACRNRSH